MSWYFVGCKRWLCIDKMKKKDSATKIDLHTHTVSGKDMHFLNVCYHKAQGTRTTLQILMHACNDTQSIPVDNLDLTLENIECAGDLPKDGRQWLKCFFNTTTSARRI